MDHKSHIIVHPEGQALRGAVAKIIAEVSKVADRDPSEIVLFVVIGDKASKGLTIEHFPDPRVSCAAADVAIESILDAQDDGSYATAQAIAFAQARAKQG